MVLAITNEDNGEILEKPQFLAGFSLQEVGGPPRNERADETGLFGDGRFADFSHLKNLFETAGNNQTRQNNALHSLSVSDDGERVYVAGGSAGFYVLDSEGIVRSRNADLAAGRAGCNQRSTIVSVGGAIDPSKLPQVANDRLRMVVNNDPGLKAFLAAEGSPQAAAVATWCS